MADDGRTTSDRDSAKNAEGFRTLETNWKLMSGGDGVRRAIQRGGYAESSRMVGFDPIKWEKNLWCKVRYCGLGFYPILWDQIGSTAIHLPILILILILTVIFEYALP